MRAAVFHGVNDLRVGDLEPLLTHRFALADIGAAYELFASRRDGVLKVAIRP